MYPVAISLAHFVNQPPSNRLSLILPSVRSPGEGNGNPLQYSCLENPMDRGAWQATVHGVTRVRHNLAIKQQSIFPLFKTHISITFNQKNKLSFISLISYYGEFLFSIFYYH